MEKDENIEYQELLVGICNIIDTEPNDIEKKFKVGEFLRSGRKKLPKNFNLIQKLAKDLNEKYKEGYSKSNLSYMQDFYLRFRHYDSIYQSVKKLGWQTITHLLSVQDIRAIEYYAQIGSSYEKIKKAIDDELFEDYIESTENESYTIEIENIRIENYKSIVKAEIVNPSPFSVFVGANGTGKSNVFEALEFLFHAMKIEGNGAIEVFGGQENILNFNHKSDDDKLDVRITFTDKTEFGINYEKKKLTKQKSVSDKLNERFLNSFSRVHFDKTKKGENKLKIHNKLWFDGGNLSKILTPILLDEDKNDNITTQLKTFIPELNRIEIKTDQLTGKGELEVYFENYDAPFTGNLISEGTYNIITILALFYQSDEPQFLCIEELENGLHPKVVKQLVEFFRLVCENEKHYVWLTTHSQTLVSEITPDEIILVEKKEGQTVLNQFKTDEVLKEQISTGDLKMDEAWLCNFLDSWS